MQVHILLFIHEAFDLLPTSEHHSILALTREGLRHRCCFRCRRRRVRCVQQRARAGGQGEREAVSNFLWLCRNMKLLRVARFLTYSSMVFLKVSQFTRPFSAPLAWLSPSIDGRGRSLKRSSERRRGISAGDGLVGFCSSFRFSQALFSFKDLANGVYRRIQCGRQEKRLQAVWKACSSEFFRFFLVSFRISGTSNFPFFFF